MVNVIKHQPQKGDFIVTQLLKKLQAKVKESHVYMENTRASYSNLILFADPLTCGKEHGLKTETLNQKTSKKRKIKLPNSVQNLPRQSANAEGFAEAYICFVVSASAKKKCWGNWICRNLTKYFSKNKKKIHFCFSNKEMSRLIKKKSFYFLHDFQIFMLQIIYCIIHRCLFSLFILLLFS